MGSDLRTRAMETLAKLDEIREDTSLDTDEKLAAIFAIPAEEREALKAYNEALNDIAVQSMPDAAARLASQKEAREKIRASRLDSVPKRLQKEVKKRELAILNFENKWKDLIAATRNMLRTGIESGNISKGQAAKDRAAIVAKEKEFLAETNRRRMELENWWRLESGDTEEPVYFPEISDALFPGAAPTKEVKFGTREAAIARAAGEVEELPEPVELQKDAAVEAVDDFLNVHGAPRSDEELAKIGRGIREAATLDMDQERQDLSKLVAKGKLTPEERDEIWLKIRNVNAIAKDNYQNALRLAYTARKLRGDSNEDHPTDRELGAATESRDKRARLAMAGRFTKELRGLYEYVTIEDPRTGELIYTRMPKIDADGNPIWEGILTRYAGQPNYSGSFNVKYMRARRSETGAWERMGMAEAQMERYSRERATAKRLFAQLVVDYNRYTKKEREQTLKVGDTLQMFTAPRDEATIKFFIREYGFQLPEWSKLRGAPRAMRSMSAADWTKEYGLRAPKVQSEDSRILQRRKEQREAKHRAIVARYKAASQS